MLMKDVLIGDLHAWEFEKTRECIVMAHGFGAVKDGLVRFAEKFGEDFSVLLFDYRNFGRSRGGPRQMIDVGMQLEDWKNAVAYAKKKYERVALWGTSFSGGHVLEIAAEEDADCAVSQVPFVDGFGTVKALGVQSVKFTAFGLLDLLLSSFNGFKIPIAGKSGLLPEKYLEIIPPDAPWENSTFARIALKVPFYRPIKKVERLKCPVLFVIAEKDSVTPPKYAYEAAKRAKNAEVYSLDCDHFDVYLDFFEEVSEVELDFFRRHLQNSG